jgi:hypothetical protein
VTTATSPERRLQERLARFRFDPGLAEEHEQRLAILQGGLPRLSGTGGAAQADELNQRESWARKALGDYYLRHTRELAIASLNADHSFTILFRHAALIDALHRFAFSVALEDLPILVALRVQSAEQELRHKRQALPAKRERLAHLEADFPKLTADPLPPAELEYYRRILAQMREDAANTAADIERLDGVLPDLQAFRADPDFVLGHIVLFARGGYGRAELSFDSDYDTGYCVDSRPLRPGQVEVLKELIMRVEMLLQHAGIETAHQYFEIDEDLSRFAAPETIHTIPSILESRPLMGSGALLDGLKAKFRSLLPVEQYLIGKVEDFEGAALPALTNMDLKEDFGGLRSIQIPLWILGVLHDAPRFETVALLELARGRGMLSLNEVARLLQALEFLYELRNFVGAAERFYYDQEARDSHCFVEEFAKHRINDALARLYLFRRHRFASVDAFDSYRLWLVDEVQSLARALMTRALDRTHVHELGPCRVSVHLGHKRIVALTAHGPAQEGPLPAQMREADAVLALFEYIAATNYDLSGELKDALVEAVRSLPAPAGKGAEPGRAARWSGILLGRYAHVALATLISIRDPLADGIATLMGRFVPEFDRMAFLLRNVRAAGMPLHQVALKSLALGQRGLEALRESHPELHLQLQPAHVLALKWSLLLHGVGALEGPSDRPARSAELAADMLQRLGYRDQALLGQVRLLIEHHRTLVTLGKTASYMDQALAQYFEIADRKIGNVVLLFLVNEAVVQAAGGRFEGDMMAVRRLFEEAGRILAELRGFPTRDQSLELINIYFDQKKAELLAETRLYLLLLRSHAVGVREAILRPLEALHARESQRLAARAEELSGLHKELVLGDRRPEEQERLAGKFVQILKQYLSEPTLLALTSEGTAAFTWFFSGFPNRYLLSRPAAQLATQVLQFSAFRTAKVLVDVVPAGGGSGDGLLVYTHGLSRSHSRVAYALSRKRVNIVLGKINRVAYGADDYGFCYYFQISPPPPDEPLVARDLELLILTETPPQLERARAQPAFQRHRPRVEFLPDDRKGYQVEASGDAYERRAASYERVRIAMRDQPFLFFKVSQLFDLHEVEVQQALIATTGNQVQDYFYLVPEAMKRLRAANFEEFLSERVNADLMQSVQ